MMGWTSFEIGVNLFQAILIVFFVRKQLRAMRRSLLGDALCVGVITFLSSLYLFFEIPITDTAIFAVPLLYGWFMSDDRWYEVLFWIVVLALVFIGGANLTSAFYRGVIGAGWDQLRLQSPLRVGMILSANLLVLIVISIITRAKRKNVVVPIYCFGLLLILNLLCLVSIEMTFSIGMSGVADLRFSVICLCLFVIAILSIVIYEIIVRSAHDHHQYVLEYERLQLTLKHNQEIESIYADMQVFRHDVKQQMQVVSRAIDTVEDDSFNQYLVDMNNRLEMALPYATGNITVDALLTSKASIMRKNGIEMAFQSYPIPNLPINDGDFCVLLGNLLDNAIEGVGRMEVSTQHRISLTFARSWDMLYIICKNPFDIKSIRQLSGRFLSSKTGTGHGVGTRSMEHIVQSANGNIRFDLVDNDFCVEIMLPYEMKD